MKDSSRVKPNSPLFGEATSDDERDAQLASLAMNAIEQRIREGKASPSELLYCAYGNSHTNQMNQTLKTAPSAVALFPLEFYLLFKEGIFYYDPEKNELIPCVEGDHRDKISMGQSFVKNAHFNLLIFANMKKKAPNERADKILNMDPSYRIKFACLDAGHCSQNVLLYCASENLKCVVRAMGDSGYFKKLLKKGNDYEYIISICIGA